MCTLKVPFQNAVKELWQFVPERDYSNAECTLVATGLTLLLVNLQSMTSKPNAGGGSKDCVTWKVEEAVQ